MSRSEAHRAAAELAAREAHESQPDRIERFDCGCAYLTVSHPDRSTDAVQLLTCTRHPEKGPTP